MSMNYQFLLYGVDDRVASITLNRTERHNASSQPLVAEIKAAVAEADPDVRVVVVSGAGGNAFSSGYDIKESAETPKRTLAE
jgi:enoyl-CoA hydratase/carnithine racemase